MAVTNVLYLDLKKPDVIQRIYVPQYDSILRVFEFHLLDGDSIYVIPDNVTITIRGTKPDKNVFAYPCNSFGETGIVTVNCEEQMTAVDGDVRCQIVMIDSSGDRLGTFTFILVVERAGMVEGTPQSDSEIAYAVQALDDIQSRSLLKFVNYSSETLRFSRVGNDV